MSTTFNPDLLRVARQVRGISQSELHKRSKVSQGAISKIESGLVEPSVEVAKKLADALEFPQSWFSLSDRVVGLPISVHPQYRKKASVGQRALVQLEADMNVQLIHIRRLLQALEYEGDLKFPEMDVDDYDGPEQIAELVRRTWMVPNGPLRDLVGLVERAGCIVIHSDFDGRAVDGVTQRLPGFPPCIFLNRNLPADRQRFTLAHEVGHLVMHRVPTPEMEVEANAFASGLLMPRRDIRPQLVGGLTLARLGALKMEWRVSMAALVYRANTLGAISGYQYRQAWTKTLASYRKREPIQYDLAVEQPDVLAEMLRYHCDELGYSVEDIGKMLHVYEYDLERLYGLNSNHRKPGLHVVR